MMMKPDDEIAFLRARDDSRVKYRQIKNLNALKEGLAGITPVHPILAADVKALPGIMGVFQLHGQTLRHLQERYPEEERIGQAISLWEDCYRSLAG
ncbi:MAG TPA: hypothetical protein VMV82_01075 [Candidatus Dormibacteraeota bacterium]|nr:hypothetical protein [Candidatus Dormibacteraeota bacterium]